MQKTPRPGSINDEFGGQTYFVAVPHALEFYFCVRLDYMGEFAFVEIVHPQSLRFADEEMIEVGAIPVRVRDFIVRAGGYEELTSAVIQGKSRSFAALRMTA